MPKIINEIPLGKTVVCDVCNKDYTNSNKTGGFIFSGYAYCPKCAEKGLSVIEMHGEEKNIQAVCPKNKSFADFCREYRGEDAKITISEI